MTISFSIWLQNRDKELAENIQNEGVPGYIAYPMMMAALGTSAARSVIPSHEQPMTAPESPHDLGGHKEDEEGNVDELGHYVAEQLMRKIHGIKNKLEDVLSIYQMPFKGWLLKIASQFFGKFFYSIKHLGSVLRGFPSVASRFINFLEKSAIETKHNISHKMSGDVEGEGLPAEVGPAINYRAGGYSGRDMVGRPYAAQKRVQSFQSIPTYKQYRKQHRG